MADSGKYKDIMDHPHPNSPTRARMGRTMRAAQFSPFAAISGHDDAIQEVGRGTSAKIELGEDAKDILDWEHQIIRSILERGEEPVVTITHFCPDPRKEGGEYATVTGKVERIDNNTGCFWLSNGKSIPFAAIVKIDIS